MNLHEYQAKEVFRAYGIPVPSGKVAQTPEEAVAAAESLGGTVWVVKAQVHAGGRGKAGGVKLAKDLAAVRTAAAEILGMKVLVTKQTGPEGLPIGKLYVEQGSQIAREIYLSLTLNRDRGRIAVIASSAGGMDIEEVAAHTPEQIQSITVHPAAGLMPYQARQLAFGLGFTGAQVAQLTSILTALYRLYMEQDASLVEINPLIVTGEGQLARSMPRSTSTPTR
jgi:succinyl-CoA synthetase beta subunit